MQVAPCHANRAAVSHTWLPPALSCAPAALGGNASCETSAAAAAAARGGGMSGSDPCLIDSCDHSLPLIRHSARRPRTLPLSTQHTRESGALIRTERPPTPAQHNHDSL